jgi:hypothetical protein
MQVINESYHPINRKYWTVFPGWTTLTADQTYPEVRHVRISELVQDRVPRL